MIRTLTKALDSQTTERLAQMWCELNSYGWPEELLAWNIPASIHSGYTGDTRPFIMLKITKLIGNKKCLLAWRGRDKSQMTDVFIKEWEGAQR